jgi:hypothetical protein
MGYLDNVSKTQVNESVEQVERQIGNLNSCLVGAKASLSETNDLDKIKDISNRMTWYINKIKELETELDKLVDTQHPPHEIEFTYNETVLETRRGSIDVPHEVYLKGERAIEEYIEKNDHLVESDMIDCEVSYTLNNISIESL